jgi:hypothetical protein
MEEKNLLDEVQPNTQPQTQVAPQEPQIELSDSEKAFIEAQRKESARLQAFRQGYEQLVKQTGYAWAVDLQSPLGAPNLGITKVG